jgi:hypothetical protein
LRKSVRACMLFASVVMLLGASLAMSYEFGSKVRNGDVDVNDQLSNFSPTMTVRYLNLGAPGLDTNDVAYLAQGTTSVVLPNDIRLTPFFGYPTGTRVRAIDPDAGLPLVTPTTGTWRYSNLYGVAGCDIDDPIYWSWSILATSTPLNVADLRMTKIQELNPGTWVKNTDVDFNNPSIWLQNATPMFHDINGNGQYDDSDSVYLKVNLALPLPDEVSPGDLRLTAISGYS